MSFHELPTHVSAPVKRILQLPPTDSLDLKLSNFKFILAQRKSSIELTIAREQRAPHLNPPIRLQQIAEQIMALTKRLAAFTHNFGHQSNLRPLTSTPFLGVHFSLHDRVVELRKKVIEHNGNPFATKKNPRTRMQNIYTSFLKRHVKVHVA